MSALLLGGAILAEVVGTLSLRLATEGRRAWYALVVLGYLLAFALLSGALAAGMPLGVAYGLWAAIGIVLTALISQIGRASCRDSAWRAVGGVRSVGTARRRTARGAA